MGQRCGGANEYGNTGEEKHMKMKTGLLCVVMVTLLQAHGWAAEAGKPRMIGTIGKGRNVWKDGNEAVLFEHQGRGCLMHCWIGGNFKGVEDTRIRYYVDGEKTPSIDMNLYM